MQSNILFVDVLTYLTAGIAFGGLYVSFGYFSINAKLGAKIAFIFLLNVSSAICLYCGKPDTAAMLMQCVVVLLVILLYRFLKERGGDLGCFLRMVCHKGESTETKYCIEITWRGITRRIKLGESNDDKNV